MLLTNLKLDKQTETPLYTQIIDSIKNQLYNDQIAAGDRLPSVRRLSAALQISRTTVENAYNQLVADGYLQNEPKRGYFAAALSGLRKHSDAPVTQSIEPPAVRYNFANNYIDPASFPSELWRRYLNRSLKINTCCPAMASRRVKQNCAVHWPNTARWPAALSAAPNRS